MTTESSAARNDVCSVALRFFIGEKKLEMINGRNNLNSNKDTNLRWNFLSPSFTVQMFTRKLG